MKKTYKKIEEKLTSEGAELRQPVAELEAPVTDSKQTEEALRESEERFHAIVSHAPVVIWSLDKEGIFTLSEGAGLKPLGLRPGEVVGQSVFDVYRDVPQISEDNRRALAGETFISIVEVGDLVYESHYSPLQDKSGEVIGMVGVSTDITDRKQAEEALQESEEFSLSLLANSPNPINVINPDTSIRYVNPALEKLTGFSLAELIGRKAPYPYWAEETSKKTAKDLEKGMRRKAVRLEELFRNKNGEQFWVEITSAPISKDGKFKYLLANWVDITDRKQAEEALRDSEEKTRKMFESVSDSISVIDLNGIIIQTNQRTVEIHGFSSKDELLGKSAFDIVAPHDREKIAKNIRQALKRGTVRDQEYSLVKSDGSEFPAELSTSVLKDTSGKAIGHITISRNITDRKKMLEALKESEERYRSLIDLQGQTGEAIVMMRDDEEKGGVYIFCNEAWSQITGYSQDELLNMPVLELMHPKDRKLSLERHRRRMRGENLTGLFDMTIIRKDGTEVPVETASVHTTYQGKRVTVAYTRDITERKRAEEKLQQSEQKYRTIFENVNDVVVRLDKRGKIIDANKRVEDYFGYKPDEIIGKYFTKLGVLSTKDLPKMVKLFGEIAKGKPLTSIELEVKHKDGSIAHLEANTTLVKKDSKIEGTIAIIRDVTKRKKDEEKLQTILKTALDGFWLTNLEGKILEVNDSYCKMVGYTRKGLLKMSISDLEAIESPRGVTQHIKKIIEQGYASFESRHKRKDGKIIDVEISVNYLDVGEKQLFVFARDITERKLAEEELKLRAQILDGATDIIQVHNASDNFVYVNEASCKSHGYSRAEFLKMKIGQIVDPGRVRTLASDRQEITKEGHIMVESAHLRKDGSVFPVEVHARTIESGEGKLFLTVAHDVTERKQAEEREKELQRELYLSSRLAAIGELAAGVAHQINNPLTGVLGFSQRLLRKSTDQETNQDLKRIYTEAERAAKVVQNLLTFARRRQPQKQYSDINEILESALELRAYELNTSNIEVITDLAPSLPEIMLDFHQIEEVFLNIILNAEQALTEANDGEKITIKTEERKGYIRTTFTDNGPGIPAENLEKIFDPFFSTKGEKGGTGLGLSVCHGIISEHGGRIYAKNKPGKGATFFIELPLPEH